MKSMQRKYAWRADKGHTVWDEAREIEHSQN